MATSSPVWVTPVTVSLAPSKTSQYSEAGESLSIELLTKVEKAEAEAEEIRAAAAREARDMLKGAEEAVLAESRAASLAHRELVTQALEQAKLDVEQEIQRTEKQQTSERAAQREQAMARIDRAAAIIFERVVNDGHR